MSVVDLGLVEARDAMARGDVSAVELMQATLKQINRWDPEINAFITVRSEDHLLAEAAQADRRRAQQVARPLEGIPVALKDNFATAGVRTTAGSRILSDWVPAQDASVVGKLKSAGALVVGKLNMHEFANGATTDNPHYGRTLNPWDKSRTPGGSSGGSGAALAMRMCYGATGSDTGGSTRTPAAICGVVGLKPTYGLVSRGGIVPFSWSLDHAGLMARSVRDVGVLLGVTAGRDSTDPASVERGLHDYTVPPEADAEGVRIGVERRYLTRVLQPDVRDVFERSLAVLGRLGAIIEEVTIPGIEASLAAEMTILFTEAVSYHRPWLSSRSQDYGADVRQSLLAGRFYSGEQYVLAQRVRAVLKESFTAVLGQVDCVALPTMPIVAPHWDEETLGLEDEGVTDLEAFIRCVVPFNLTGLPAISVPAGLSRDGIPLGLQLASRAFDEAGLLRLAASFEREAIEEQLRPPLLRTL